MNQTKPYEVAIKGEASIKDLIDMLNALVPVDNVTTDDLKKMDEILTNMYAMSSVIEAMTRLITYINKPALDEAMRVYTTDMLKESGQIH